MTHIRYQLTVFLPWFYEYYVRGIYKYHVKGAEMEPLETPREWVDSQKKKALEEQRSREEQDQQEEQALADNGS